LIIFGERRFQNFRLTNDNEVDKKELNLIPYTQALRIDHRTYLQMFLSVFAHEIEIIEIFYYRNYNHLSITLSIYLCKLCLDLTLNCLFYTDDVVSQKYNNDGSIEIMISLSIAFMSNIFASLISYIIKKLANYSDFLEFIIKDASFKEEYLMNFAKFKKFMIIKLTCFYLVQIIINSAMCYYLMIFCAIYHKTQGSVMVNYIIGIVQSLAISFGLIIFISLMRYLGLTYRLKYFYNSSKYLFENF
jgi:hypothetical protein